MAGRKEPVGATTVLGNHDWLNGPDVLLDVFKQAKPRLAIVSRSSVPAPSGAWSHA